MWDADQYLRFADWRERPALELLARIPVDHAADVVDLGCGPGTITAHLLRRWPDANVTCVDTSPEMLARAAEHVPGATLVEDDLAAWEPPGEVDVVYSNAALHWVPEHGPLLARFIGWLRPGGALGVQMPGNFDEPTHREARALAADPRFEARLAGHLDQASVADPADYVRWLRPLAAHVDVWETRYHQLLDGPDHPVAEWMRGAFLRPWLEALGSDADAFVSEYARRMRVAYPAADDGVTVLPYRRLFLVATKEGAA